MFNRHITLQTKTATYFAGGFLLVWIIVSAILFRNFKSALIASFDEQLKARAFVVIQKTNVSPKIVPLPQGDESFVIIYATSQRTDTLFKPIKVPFQFPQKKDQIVTNNGWRVISIQYSLENGGYLLVIYGLPATSLNSKIHETQLLISLVLPIGFLLAIIIAWWLSYNLLRPIKQVVNLANAININNDVNLLEEPDNDNEIKELIVSFNRMLLRIREQSSRQTAFFASASHELRTPLSVMNTRLQVLLQASSSQEVKIIYNEQLKEVQQLIKMVNDFLLLSELRTGKIEIVITECSLSDIILETVTKYKSKWTAKELQFKISYSPVETNYDVFADESKLKIIISNLTENAIKYAPEKSVIDITVTKLQNKFSINLTNKIRYDINPAITDIKNEFYHSKPLHGEGYGLGLWIASQLAALQDIGIYFTIKQKEYFEASIIFQVDKFP